jgi:hypothetical protein
MNLKISCSTLRMVQGASTFSMLKVAPARRRAPDLLGIALGVAIDQDLRDVPLQEVQGPDQHALVVEA